MSSEPLELLKVDYRELYKTGKTLGQGAARDRGCVGGCRGGVQRGGVPARTTRAVGARARAHHAGTKGGGAPLRRAVGGAGGAGRLGVGATRGQTAPRPDTGVLPLPVPAPRRAARPPLLGRLRQTLNPRPLLSGAFGKVKLATRKADGTDVAVKLVNTNEWSERERRQFENEICTLYELQVG